MVVAVWEESGEEHLCLCPQAGEDVAPELGDVRRLHGVAGLCLEGGCGLAGGEDEHGGTGWGRGIRVACIAEGLADDADELLCVGGGVVVVAGVERGHV